VRFTIGIMLFTGVIAELSLFSEDTNYIRVLGYYVVLASRFVAWSQGCQNIFPCTMLYARTSSLSLYSEAWLPGRSNGCFTTMLYLRR
jgi:hypothetical protein